jgi:hypothetical protein
MYKKGCRRGDGRKVCRGLASARFYFHPGKADRSVDRTKDFWGLHIYAHMHNICIFEYVIKGIRG